MPTRALRATVLALAVWGVLVPMAAPDTAQAGTYRVYACVPWVTGDNYVVPNEVASTGTFYVESNCTAGGGVFALTGAYGASANPQNASVGMTVGALPSTSYISGYQACSKGTATSNVNYFSQVWLWTSVPSASIRDSYNAGGGNNDWASHCASETGLAANTWQAITLYTICAGSCSGALENEWSSIYVDVGDTTPPTHSGIGGTLLCACWTNGTKTASWTTSDVNGITASAVYSPDGSGGWTLLGTFGGGCQTTYTQLQPCGSPQGPGYTIDTSLMIEGSQTVILRSWDAAGNYRDTNQTAYIDRSAPPAVTTLSGPAATNGSPSLTWSTVADAYSGTSYYKVYRSTSSGSLGTSIGTSGSGSYTDNTGGMTNGNTYYYTVRAVDNLGIENGAGNQIAVKYDTTAPSVPASINDGAGADIDVLGSTGAVSMNWAASSDGFSGVQQYQWALVEVSGWVWRRSGFTAGTSVTTAATPTLNDGNHASCVQAQDNAGNWSSWQCSDYFMVDTTAPVAPGTPGEGGTAGSGSDLDYVTSTGALTITWTAGSDAHSGIAGYNWCIGTGGGSGGCTGTLRSNTTSGTGVTTSATGTAFANNTSYKTCVATRDNVGLLSSYACSDNVFVDTTAPVPAVPNDGAGADIDSQASSAALNANWTAASDPGGSGPSSYSYCFTSNNGNGCATPVSGTGTSGSGGGLTAAATSLDLSDIAYYVCIRATDVAGNVSGWQCSDGVTPQTTLGIGVDSTSISTSPASFAPNTNATASTTVTVQTNHSTGYVLTARDGSDTAGATCCTGSGAVPDWTGTDATPTVWASTTSGYWGVTVLAVSNGSRLAKWGAGTTTETDYANNRYVGLKASSDTTLHTRGGFGSGSEDVTVAYRTRVASSQLAGSYSSSVTYTLTAAP